MDSIRAFDRYVLTVVKIEMCVCVCVCVVADSGVNGGIHIVGVCVLNVCSPMCVCCPIGEPEPG